MKTNRIRLAIAAIAITVQLIFGFQNVLPGSAHEVAESGTTAGRGVCNDIACG